MLQVVVRVQMIKEYQYEFGLDIDQVKLEKPPKGPVEIWWCRGNNKIATKRRVNASILGQWYEVSEKLGIQAVCKWSKQKFHAKMYEIKVMAVTNVNGKQHQEVYGMFHLDISSVLNGRQHTKQVSEVRQDFLQNHIGQVKYVLSAKFIQELYAPSLDNTTSEYNITRPVSRHSENSVQFSFQMQSTGREPSHDRQSSNGNNETFLQLIEVKRRLDEKNKESVRMQQELTRKEEVVRGLEMENKQRDVRLMNEVNILGAENSALKAQLEEMNRYLVRAREDQQGNEERVRKIQELENENFRKYNEYISVENRSAQKLKELSALVDRLNEEKGSLLSQVGVLGQKAKETERLRFQTEMTSNNERNLSETKIRALQEKSREKEAVVDKIKSQFNNYSIEMNNLMTKQKQARMELQQQNSTIRKLEESVSSYKNAVNQLENTARECSLKLDTREKEYVAREREYTLKEKEYIGKIKELEEACQKKSNDLRERTGVIDKAKEFVEYKQEEIRKRDEFITKCKEYINTKEQELSASISTNESLRHELQEKDAVVQRLSEETISLKERLRMNLEEAKALREQIQVKEKHLSDYLSDLAATTSRTTQLEQQIECLQSQLEELRQQNWARQQQVKSSLSDLVKQNVQYKLQLSKSHNEIKRLQERLER